MRIITSRTAEKWYPFVAAMLAGVGFYFSPIAFPTGEGILSAGLTIGAIFTAFIATNKSLILTLDTRIMRKLRASEWFPILISYLRSALWSSFVFSILCLVLYFVKLSDHKLIAAFWVFNCAYMVLSFFRVTSVLLTLVDDRKK